MIQDMVQDIVQERGYMVKDGRGGWGNYHSYKRIPVKESVLYTYQINVNIIIFLF